MATDVIRSGISPELDLITVIRPVLRSLIVAHTFLTLLIPLSLMVLHYSTPHTRRQPIFILNVVILLVAFSFGTIVDAVGVGHPTPSHPTLTVLIDFYHTCAPDTGAADGMPLNIASMRQTPQWCSAVYHDQRHWHFSVHAC